MSAPLVPERTRLEKVFGIESPSEVGSAIQRLLITGTTALDKSAVTIWPDIKVSLLEISGGIIVSGFVGFLIAQAFSKNTLFKFAWILSSLVCVAPVVLPAQIVWWVGIGLSQKVLTITSFTTFPFAQALWSYRSLRLPLRVLVAIEEVLPYAFIGMVFAEAYAATAGLGFFVLVAAGKGYVPEAIATAFITFGILAVNSCVFRFAIRRLYFSQAAVNAIPLVVKSSQGS